MRRPFATITKGEELETDSSGDRSRKRAHFARREATRSRILCSPASSRSIPKGSDCQRHRARKWTQRWRMVETWKMACMGQLRASEIARDRVEDARTVLKVDQGTKSKRSLPASIGKTVSSISVHQGKGSARRSRRPIESYLVRYGTSRPGRAIDNARRPAQGTDGARLA